MGELLSGIFIKYQNLIQIKSKLDLAKKQHSMELMNLEKLKNSLYSEKMDVEKLEKVSFKSLWFDLLNKKAENLEKEKAEYFQAKLNFETQFNKVEKLETEIRDYESKIVDYEKVKGEFEQLLSEEVNVHKNNESPISIEIAKLEKQKSNLKLEMFEVEEAFNATKKVLDLIPNVTTELKSAKMYSTWDMMGGGMVSTYLKRDKMSLAKGGILEVNYALSKLKRELKDIKREHFPENLELDLSWEFVDYFFDNIFTDFNISQKINQAYNSCISTYNSLIPIENALRNEKLKMENRFIELENMVQKLVLKNAK